MGNQDESLEKQLKPFNFPFSIFNLFVFLRGEIKSYDRLFAIRVTAIE